MSKKRDVILKEDAFPKPKHGMPVWAERAIEVFRETGKVTQVYKKVMGLKRADVAQMLMTNEDFAQAWSDVKEEQIDKLRESMLERATVGVKEPVFYKGKKVAKVRKPSDSLAMFMLKGLDSETFGDKRNISVTNRHIRIDVRRFDEQGVEIFGEDHYVNDPNAVPAEPEDDSNKPRVLADEPSLMRTAKDIEDVEIRQDPDNDDLDGVDEELREILGESDSCPFV